MLLQKGNINLIEKFKYIRKSGNSSFLLHRHD